MVGAGRFLKVQLPGFSSLADWGNFVKLRGGGGGLSATFFKKLQSMLIFLSLKEEDQDLEKKVGTQEHIIVQKTGLWVLILKPVRKSILVELEKKGFQNIAQIFKNI